MVSQSSTTTPREPTAAAAAVERVLLVLGFGDPAAADYLAFASGRSGCAVVGDPAACRGRAVSVVLWLPARLTDADRAALDAALAVAPSDHGAAESVTLVSSVRAHLGDEEALAAEA